MEQTRFVRSGEPKYSDRRNAAQASRQIKTSQVCADGLFAIEGHRRGEQVKRLPGNWSIVDREAMNSSTKAMERDLLAWCSSRQYGQPARKLCQQAFRKALPSHHEVGAPQAEQDYVSSMSAGADEVLVQDDKDRRRTWLCQQLVFQQFF